MIGYGERVGPALAGKLAARELVSIVDVYNNPARLEKRKAERVNAVGELTSAPRAVYGKGPRPLLGKKIDCGGSIDRIGVNQLIRIIKFNGW